MDNEFHCVNCGHIGSPSKHGKCASCGSDAIMDPRDPEPVRYQRTRTGIERMEAEG